MFDTGRYHFLNVGRHLAEVTLGCKTLRGNRVRAFPSLERKVGLALSPTYQKPAELLHIPGIREKQERELLAASRSGFDYP